MSAYEDVSRRADRLAEAEALEAELRDALEKDGTANPFLTVNW